MYTTTTTKLTVLWLACVLVAPCLAEIVRVTLHQDEEAHLHELAAQMQCTVRGRVPGTPHTFLMKCADGAAGAAQQPHTVAHMEAQVARRRVARGGVPEDPLYASQWHLHGSPSPRSANRLLYERAHVDAPGAWRMGYSGRGVTITVVDDGVQHTHPDLVQNYAGSLSFDVNDHDNDPRPHSGDSHGTSAAGVAAAGENAYCGVGVAPNATLAAIRLIAEPVTDGEEAQGLVWGDADVYSCSWGPVDDGRRLERPGPLAMAAVEHATRFGRGGLGSVFVWAAGNGGQAHDNCNYDGYASSRYVITVGAVGEYGRKTFYSEPCSAMLVCAPSSDSYVGITTTALDGACTNQFGGTSSATPLVAGIVALMLEARPDATWRDVRHALVMSAVHTDPTHPLWHTNGAGLSFNPYYGFGRVVAPRAVEAIMNTSAPEAVAVRAPGARPYLQVPRSGAWVDSTTRVANERVHSVECAELTLWLTHPRRGDIEVELESPAGTVSRLATQHADRAADYDGWMFTTCSCWGEPSEGLWTLRVRDAGRGVAAGLSIVQRWDLTVHGW